VASGRHRCTVTIIAPTRRASLTTDQALPRRRPQEAS
jgi:hypothetical protein